MNSHQSLPRTPKTPRSRRRPFARFEALEDRRLLAVTYQFELLDPPGSISTRATGINNARQITGYYQDSSGWHGYVKDASGYTPFDVAEPGVRITAALAINDRAEIGGAYYLSDGIPHGFVKDNAGHTTIAPPNSSQSGVNGLNNGGLVVGNYKTSSGSLDFSFLYDGSGYSSIDAGVLGGIGTMAVGINDQGTIVGYYDDPNVHKRFGFLLDETGYHSLDVPFPGSVHTQGMDINESGIVVGEWGDNSGRVHGFRKDASRYSVLDVPFPGVEFSWAFGNNDSGQVVGYYEDGAGRIHGYLATPVSDIRLDSLTGDGAATLTATYTIADFPAQPFDLGFYRSSDASLDAGDQTLATVTISDPADLSVGQHVKTWTIGGAAGQIPLPGAGVAENDLEYHLLAVADPSDALVEGDADPTNEDNTTALVGVYRGSAGDAYVHGGAGDTAVNVGLAGANTLVITVDGFDYSIPGGRNASVPSLRVRTHAGDDTLSTTYPDKSIFYLGAAGSDTVLGPNLSRNWVLSGVDAGRTGLTTFVSVENLAGGSATDNFRFANGFGVSGFIHGGGGVNTLDYTLYKTPVAVNLAAGTATSVGAGASSIANVSGGDAADVLVGDGGANFLKGSSGPDSLTGGLGDDAFDGGSGLDCLVETADLNLTLTATTLAGLGSDTLLSIERALLTGGAGNNLIDASAFAGNAILRGLGGNDQLLGGPGRDLLFGGAGADTFHGGAGEDLLLSGTTVHDATDAALLAVLAEWNSTRSFFTRIANIRGNGSGPRFNGTTFLTPGVAAFDTTPGDSLAGGADLDWYFIALGDALTDISTGELVDIL